MDACLRMHVCLCDLKVIKMEVCESDVKAITTDYSWIDCTMTTCRETVGEKRHKNNVKLKCTGYCNRHMNRIGLYLHLIFRKYYERIVCRNYRGSIYDLHMCINLLEWL